MATVNLWVECKECQKQIPVSAKTCPHCGKSRRRITPFRIGVGFAAVIGLLWLIGSNNDKTSETRVAEAPISTNVNVAEVIPTDQAEFIKTVSGYINAFRNTKNELQQSMLRDERKKSIFYALKSGKAVSGWTGTISHLETTSRGDAILGIRIADKTIIKTWNNSFSDLSDSTLITKGSTLFNALSSMSVGDSVSFSGSFLPSDTDGIKETSVTLRGSMTEPEFLFHFKDVSLH